MALILHIRAVADGSFSARVFEGRQLVGTSSGHATIEDAIGAFGGQHGSLRRDETFELWFEGWTVGTVTAEQMRTTPGALADRLQLLSALQR